MEEPEGHTTAIWRANTLYQKPSGLGCVYIKLWDLNMFTSSPTQRWLLNFNSMFSFDSFRPLPWKDKSQMYVFVIRCPIFVHQSHSPKPAVRFWTCVLTQCVKSCQGQRSEDGVVGRIFPLWWSTFFEKSETVTTRARALRVTWSCISDVTTRDCHWNRYPQKHLF